MRSSRIFLLLILVIVAVVAGLFFSNKTKNGPTSTSQTSTTAPSTVSNAPSGGNVKMTSMLFTPSQITVAKGGTVTWTNNDTVTHTVVDDLSTVSGPSSGNIEPGSTYSFTFEKTGSFQYHCSIHSSMRGTIVVK